MYKCIIILLLLIISGCMDVTGSYDNENLNGPSSGTITQNIIINNPENVYINGSVNMNTTSYQNIGLSSFKFEVDGCGQLTIENLTGSNFPDLRANIEEENKYGIGRYDPWYFDVGPYSKANIFSHSCNKYTRCYTIRTLSSGSNMLWHGQLKVCGG